MSKKINAALKRAYYYFDFKQVVPYNEVVETIQKFKGLENLDDELANKINQYAEEIEEYFDTPEKREDDTVTDFAKNEPRKSWEHYTDDFDFTIDELGSEQTEDAEDDEIEPVEDELVDSIEPVEEDEADEIEPVEETIEVVPPRPIIKEKPSQTKIYINGELLGYCADPVNFTQEMREKRRNGEVSYEMNITYYEDNNEIYIFNDPGRARRPLIIVKDGVPLLKDEHLNKIASGKLKWDDLISQGLVEYLDAEEEENSYIAMSLAELNDEHTHLEIDPATMLGICAGIIPFSDHNSSPRNTMEAGMTKQALGLYVSNYALRTDTRAHLLHHPQTPIVKTRIIDSTNYDLRPSGQNFVVALMSYEGYNM